MPGRAPGICHRMKAAADAKEGTGRKRLKLQRRIVQKSLGFRISGLQNLKAVGQKEPFDNIGLDATANAIGSLHDTKIEALGLEATSTAQPGEARPHNDYIQYFCIHFIQTVSGQLQYRTKFGLNDDELPGFYFSKNSCADRPRALAIPIRVITIIAKTAEQEKVHG